MNRVILDYDCNDLREKAKAVIREYPPSSLEQWKDMKSGAQLSEGGSDRCVLISRMQGGWKKEHADLLVRNASVPHWVIGVISDGGVQMKSLMRKDILSNLPAGCYVEVVIIGEEDWSALRTCLARPAKTGKSCMVISREGSLAKDIAALLQHYLRDWQVRACDSPDRPAYQYVDATLTVGNSIADMDVPCAGEEVRQKLFWLNDPLFQDRAARDETLDAVQEAMNGRGWNIAYYSDVLFVSSLGVEQALIRLASEEIDWTALKLDEGFVMWDCYGLPVPESQWTKERVFEFLRENTCFKDIAETLETPRNGRGGANEAEEWKAK